MKFQDTQRSWVATFFALGALFALANGAGASAHSTVLHGLSRLESNLVETESHQSIATERKAPLGQLPEAALVCEGLKTYPKPQHEKLSFENGEVSRLCRPFVKLRRRELDRCGDFHKDPYANSKRTSSTFTWSSRNEMARKGKGNLYLDEDLQPLLPKLHERIAQLKSASMDLCCSGDEDCRRAIENVEVSVCRPASDPDAPDPCVFGGSFRMSGRGYDSIFRAIHKTTSNRFATALGSSTSASSGASESGSSRQPSNSFSNDLSELKRLAQKNLSHLADRDGDGPSGPVSGTIVLSSYVSRKQGIGALEPVILHEFGHACSMIKMQHAALDLPTETKIISAEAQTVGANGIANGEVEKAALDSGALSVSAQKAIRATQWLDRARSRCQSDLELPEAYFDFWESVGESREFSQCLFDLTAANQKQVVDRPCPGLCPGHYLEESVGIAFSMLLGDLGGVKLPSAVFPQTCDHVRDGQHPLVSDVVECLAQHSPRFRSRLKTAYGCESR